MDDANAGPHEPERVVCSHCGSRGETS
jgi:hypothetical protein